MSRYTGYNQTGFANSTVAVTRAAVGTTTPINHANTISIGDNNIYGAFDTTTDVLNATSTYVGGNTAINTTTKKFGSGSLSVGGGNNNYLRIQNVLTSSGDYTVEFFFKTNNITTTNQCVMDLNQSNSTHSGNSPYGYIQMWLSHAVGSAGQLRVWQSTGGTSWQSSGILVGTISADTWHHVAIIRSGSTTYYFVDGVAGGSTNVGTSIYTGGGYTYLGRRGRATYYLHGDNTFIDDFLVTSGTAKYATGGFTPPTRAAGAGLDAVSLYLPFDSDVNDDSSYGHTVTASGSAAISSTQSKFGGNSLSLNGTNQYLTVSNDTPFQFGDGDFTIEMWIYMTSNAGSGAAARHALVARRASSSNRSFHVGIQLDGGLQKLQFSHSTSGSGGSQTNYATDIQLNTWTHIAIVRSGSSVFAFVDGVKNGTSHSIGTDTIYVGTSDLTIGYRPESSQYFPGYIDDLRISKGIARYTKSFIPPSQAGGATLDGTNETNTTTDFTSLYLPFDADLNDDSNDSVTVTVNGGAAVSSTQSKFGGSSLYLNGSGDFLTVPKEVLLPSSASYDFTVEMWVYPTTLVNGRLWSQWGGGSNRNLLIQTQSDGDVQVYIRSSGGTESQVTSSGGLTVNTWAHVAVVRSIDKVILFIDGVQKGSIDISGDLGAYASAIGIGGRGDSAAAFFEGYIDDLRILKGYAKYTADFTVPTTAVGTSVSETVNDLTTLYLPFDGTTTTLSYTPSFYAPYDSDVNDDSSYGHTGTTGGDPTISSTQSKFGGYSLHLDGNDYVSYGNHSSFDIEDEDFTIEGWAYRTSNVTYGTLAAKWDSSGNQRSYILRFNVNGHLYFYRSDNGNSYQEFSGNDLPAVGLNTWAHFAFVKNGRYGYFYVNGQRSSQTADMYNSGTSAFYTSSAPLSIGAINVGSSPTNHFAGYLDDIKITKGFAKYGLTNFTPPSSALGSSAETEDVLKGGFEDLARNHAVVTKSGSPVLSSSVKKFGTSSLDLTGGSDYVWYNHDESLNFGTGDFTVEAWFYVTNSNSRGRWLGKSNLSPYYGWFIVSNTNNTWGFNAGSGTSGQGWDIANNTSLGTLTRNVWTHLAITREGNTFRLFNNGSLISTLTSDLTMTISDAPFGIGRQGGNASQGVGYIDDIRVIKGKAIYTAAFTPPASAHGHVSLAISSSSSETYSDTKFLSGVWDMTDVRDKMMQSTWVSNDSRLPNGAGLQDSNHRWYTPPPAAPVTIESWGAGGARGQPPGWGQYNPGGGGGYAKATFTLDTGTSLNVVVGDGGGRDGTTDFGNHQVGPAGGGGANPGNDDTGGGAGGGYSGVFEGPVSQENALIIAGGGGGGSSYPSAYGGAGGGTTGNNATGVGAGSGGTQSAGGAGGSGSTPGQQGSALLGGTKAPNGPRAGAGGGGGYFGGGSGGMSPHAGAGGGGSGYIHPSGTETTLTTGGNGSSSGGTTGGPAISFPSPRGGGNYGSTSSGGEPYPGRGNPGYVRITDPAGTHTFTAPGTHTVS